MSGDQTLAPLQQGNETMAFSLVVLVQDMLPGGGGGGWFPESYL